VDEKLGEKSAVFLMLKAARTAVTARASATELRQKNPHRD
jgi:hypothetical protein